MLNSQSTQVLLNKYLQPIGWRLDVDVVIIVVVVVVIVVIDATIVMTSQPRAALFCWVT